MSSNAFGCLNCSYSPYDTNTNFSSVESFSDNKLHFIEDTDYIFIHIPKTGGTSFCKRYLKYQVSHVKAHNYDEEQLKKSVTIVRNPYSRIISCYKYFKTEKTYWGKTNYKLLDYCKTNSFSNLVDDLYNKSLPYDQHLEPQHNFLKKKEKIFTKIMKLENLEEDFYKIFKKKLDMEHLNKSVEIEINISEDTKNKIYEIYKKDFELFGYLK